MFLEKYNAKKAFEPKNLNTAAVTGSRISLAGVDKIAVVIELGTSLTGAAVVVTLQQHNAASGGTSKDLEVAHPYFKKVGAATKFTKVEQSSAEAQYDHSADFDTSPGTLVFEIDASDLDLANDFSHFSINIADSVVDKIASAHYIAIGSAELPAYKRDV